MKLIRFLILSFIVFGPIAAFGQLRIGPLGGASLTQWSFAEEEGSDAYSSRRGVGFHGGMAVNYKVNDRYSLQTEWLYLYRQKDVEYNLNKLYVRDQASLHYLAIPLLYRVSFHTELKKSHQEWYLNAGPALHYWLGGKGTLATNEQAGFLENGTMNYVIRFSAPEEYGNTEYIEPANRWKMALYAGGGVVFDLGFGRHIFVDARTSLGAAKSNFATTARGDYGLQLYHDNLQSSIVSWSVSAGFFQDIHMMAVLKKGKSINQKSNSKKGKKKAKTSR